MAVGDLFSDAANERLPETAPLALRMRPQRLDDFVGQEQILGEQSALRLAIAEDRVGSSILYGPPGSGKTTLARVIANTTGAYFEELSAVSATVSQVREVIAGARERLGAHGAADDPLPRRDPPLQQGAAGRAPAGGRRGSPDVDRRDDREPVLRGQLRAALPVADLRARAALGRGAGADRAPRGRRARDGGLRRDGRADRTPSGRRCAERPQHPGARVPNGQVRGTGPRTWPRRRCRPQAAARLRQGR